MKDYRCYKCKGLLYKAQGEVDAEIICCKCRTINYPLRSDQSLGLRGQDFQRTSVDHRCDNCTRLLVKTNGDGVIEIKCKYCKHLSEHVIKQGKFEYKRTSQRQEIKKNLAQ